MNVDYKQIGSYIKQARKMKRVTQEQLAELLGVSIGYVSQVERGVTKISLDLLAAVAFHLDQEISYFLDGVSKTNENYLDPTIQHYFANLTPAQKCMAVRIIQVISESADEL